MTSAKCLSIMERLPTRHHIDEYLLASSLIQYQFNEANKSYYWYNSKRLNDSYDAIEAYSTRGTATVGLGFLLATLSVDTPNPATSSSPSLPLIRHEPLVSQRWHSSIMSRYY